MHYLLEPGWKADTAIQGLGRSNRTNQAQPPLFRPVATNVKRRKAVSLHHRQAPRQPRRHHARPAPDRRARPFPRPRTISKAPMPRAALVELYTAHPWGEVAFPAFQLRGSHGSALAAKAAAAGGTAADHTFLNRVLALPIALQNRSSSCSRNCWKCASKLPSRPAPTM